MRINTKSTPLNFYDIYISPETGDVYYYNDKHQISRLDGPAKEYSNGTKYWYVNGKRHRLDGPAIEWSDGYKAWYIDGKLHRTDGPAIEYSNGIKEWCINDKFIGDSTNGFTNKDFEEYKKKHNIISSLRLGVQNDKEIEANTETVSEGNPTFNEEVSQPSEEVALIYPTIDEIDSIHTEIVNQYGGRIDKFRDWDVKLEAAIANSQNYFADTAAFSSSRK